VRLVNITEDAAALAMARKAGETFKGRDRAYTESQSEDPKAGEFFMVRWTPFSVLVVKLEEAFEPRVYETWALGVGELPPLKGDPSTYAHAAPMEAVLADLRDMLGDHAKDWNMGDCVEAIRIQLQNGRRAKTDLELEYETRQDLREKMGADPAVTFEGAVEQLIAERNRFTADAQFHMRRAEDSEIRENALRGDLEKLRAACEELERSVAVKDALMEEMIQKMRRMEAEAHESRSLLRNAQEKIHGLEGAHA
jgi:hypothetical protein